MLRVRLTSLLVVLIVYTMIFCMFDKGHFNGLDAEEHLHQRIFNRLYFTMTTTSTVGYGDIILGALCADISDNVTDGDNRVRDSEHCHGNVEPADS